MDEHEQKIWRQQCWAVLFAFAFAMTAIGIVYFIFLIPMLSQFLTP